MWNIVQELVDVDMNTKPDNPFAVNFQIMEQMPPLERALQVKQVYKGRLLTSWKPSHNAAGMQRASCSCGSHLVDTAATLYACL